jgi:hypothetical protein
MSRRHTICPLCESTLPTERDAQPLWDEWTAARGNAQVRRRAEELARRVLSGLEDLDRLKRWLATQGQDEVAERVDEVVRELRDRVSTFRLASENDDGI